jgi:putative tryptophan/tyrosine transport system substrate-binding protein
MMRRREFITLLGGSAAAWTVAARAQQPDRIQRIGVLLLVNAEAESLLTDLREGLRKSGYIEGKIHFEVRSADGKLDLLPSLAAELVALKVDVIVAQFTPSALAAKRATSEIPIVFLAGDAVGTGVVPSLARPAGNLTGLSLMVAELHGKCVELLRDMLPSVRRVAALGYAADPFSKSFVDQVQLAGRATGIEIDPIMMLNGPDEIDSAFVGMETARALGSELHVVNAGSQGEFDPAFATLIKQRAGGLIVSGDAFFNSQLELIVALAARHAVPTIYEGREFAAAGGFVSYGPRRADEYHLTGIYAGKILNGAKPTDLPIQLSTRVELVINLKTANSLGITVPLPLLGRAEEVIE